MLSNMSGARSRKGCDGMAKAVLVMDMPENCFKCKLQNWANCKITNKCHVGGCRPELVSAPGTAGEERTQNRRTWRKNVQSRI